MTEKLHTHTRGAKKSEFLQRFDSFGVEFSTLLHIFIFMLSKHRNGRNPIMINRINTTWVVCVCVCFPDCDRSCLTCSGPHPSSCLSCRHNMRKDVNGHCEFYSNCSQNTYEDKDGQCKLCHASCLRCSGAEEHLCLSCPPDYYLLSEFLTLLRFIRLFGTDSMIKKINKKRVYYHYCINTQPKGEYFINPMSHMFLIRSQK